MDGDNTMENRIAQDTETTEEILVAVDASPHSLAALAAAADLAALLGQKLHALYVEDINLLRLAGLPFCREVGSYTASVRLLDTRSIERTFERSAAAIQRSIERVTQTRRISYTFRVVRGGVTDALAAASQSATFVSLGRVGHSPGRRIGSTTQMLLQRLERPLLIASASAQLRPPFTVLFSGSPASRNALQLAVNLARKNERVLTVWIWAKEQSIEQIEELLRGLVSPLQGVAFDGVLVQTSDQLHTLLAQHTQGTLILPVDQAEWISSVETAVIVAP
jgi:nucleotide-binding universal stress UspA family protein